MNRFSQRILAAAVFAALVSPVFAQGLRTDDWYRLNRVSDVQFAPDAKNVAYVSARANRDTQRNESQIWLIAADGRSDARLLTTSFANASQPRYSPDGTRIAFLGSREQGERPQIYVAPVGGGAAARLTNLENGVTGFVWAPDGRQFAIVARVGKREERNDPLSGVTVVRNLHFAQDGRGLLKDQRAHVFVVDIATGAARQITEGEFDHADPAWSPDSRWLAFSADRTGTADNGSRNTDVFIVPAAGGTPRKVSPHAEANGAPAFSPDGTSIAFTGVAAEGGQSDIYTMPVDGGTAVNLTEAFDERIQRFVWTAGGIYFTTNMRGEVPLFKLDVSARKVEKIAAQQGAQVTSFSLANDGAIAVTRSGFRHPADVFVGAPGAAPNRHLTDVNRQLLAERALAPVEALTYKADDGMEIQGWLVKPLSFDPARKYPLVLRIHGGPAGMYGTNFDHEVHVLSARGYAVLFINPRGSTGYGQTFVRANQKDWAGKDFTDLMKGVDTALARHGWIDPQRLAVYGCSYGGYMTNWIITQTTRFAAAAPECAMSDMVTLWGTTDGARSPEDAFGGTPWEQFDLWWARSPLKFANKVKTPALFIHGEQDYRVPLAQAQQMFRALKRHGVDTEMVIYAGESHGEFANGKPAHYVDRIERVIAWFDRYMVARKQTN
jgi:dipeptidyl aminopeptidase/acylaminoacyl peptidase